MSGSGGEDCLVNYFIHVHRFGMMVLMVERENRFRQTKSISWSTAVCVFVKRPQTSKNGAMYSVMGFNVGW